MIVSRTDSFHEKYIVVWSLVISFMFLPVNLVIFKQHLSPSFTVSGVLMSISFFALGQLVRLSTTPEEKLNNSQKILKPIIILLWVCVKIICIASIIGFLKYYPYSSPIGVILGITVIPAVLLLKSVGKILVNKTNTPNQQSKRGSKIE